MRAYYWNGCWLGAVFVCLILAAGCANPVRGTPPCENPNKASAVFTTPETEISNEANQTNDLSQTSRFFESAKTDFANWPNRIIEDSKDSLFRKDNFTALLLAGGASIAMHQSDADKDIAKNFESNNTFNDWTDKTFDLIGGPGFHFAATGFWYALSADSGDEFNRDRAWTMMTALATTGLVTVGLKGIRDNETPNGKKWAWPSGHTASSFTVASVLDEFYGPEVGIPAYILASLVGWRMMDTGDHWASDVVFGATLGWVVGHTVAGKHKELEIAGFKVLPYTASANGSVVGINLFKRF
jgi:membrane-associated phospholipid phosphatase